MSSISEIICIKKSKEKITKKTIKNVLTDWVKKERPKIPPIKKFI